jgi:hypothetical protein
LTTRKANQKSTKIYWTSKNSKSYCRRKYRQHQFPPTWPSLWLHCSRRSTRSNNLNHNRNLRDKAVWCFLNRSYIRRTIPQFHPTKEWNKKSLI